MTNPIIKLVNAETGEEIEREMTAEELAVVAANELAENQRLAVRAQKAAEKQQILAQLGITEEQAKLLLS